MPTPLGTEFIIGGGGANPKIAILNNGNFIVVWEAFDMYCRVYDPNANPLGSRFRIGLDGVGQGRPSIAPLDTGNFIVTWNMRTTGTTREIRAQLFDSTGNSVGNEFRVDDPSGPNRSKTPSVTNLTNGNFVIVWTTDGDQNLSVQLFDINANPIGNQIDVLMQYPRHQSVSSLSNGNIAIVWESNSGIESQVFNSSGNPISSAVISSSGSGYPSVAGLDNGNFVLAWGESSGPKGRLFSNNGTPIGNQFPISSVIGLLKPPSVTKIDHGFCVTYQTDFTAISGKLFDNLAASISSEFQINTSASGNFGTENPAVKSDSKGNFIVTWDDQFIYAQRFYGPLQALNFNQNNTYIEDSNYNFSGIEVVSPSDNVTVSLTLSDTGAGSLPIATQGSVTSTFNAITGEWQASGNRADVNTLLSSLEFSPTQDYDNNFSISGNVVDEINTSLNSTITMTAIPVNDKPILLTNQLTINEGQTVTFNAFHLNATDVDSVDSNLIFTISNFQNGRFELVSSPNVVVAVTSFTQQNITNNQVQFVHDGSENPPAYSVTVSDQLLTTTPSAATINFTNVNDLPQLVNNQLTIMEGQSITVSVTNLSATDVETDDSTLLFIVSDVLNGQFELSSNPRVTITSFTQQQVIFNQVVFIHDGSEQAPSYKVAVSDGVAITTPAPAAITFDNRNDAPILQINTLTIDEGEAKVLGSTDLLVTDVDNTADQLTIMVSNVQHGNFEFVNNPGVVITNFTQQAIDSGNVKFFHDGGENKPAYAISVSDGIATVGPSEAMVVFNNINDAPQLVNNNLIIVEGRSLVLSSSNLSATDVDSPVNNLIFIISNINHGQFELVSNPGAAITNFTQQQIINSQVRFVHDGSQNAPSFDIAVSDGDKSTAPVPAVVYFTDIPGSPFLVKNTLIIREGKTKILTPNNLLFADDDTTPNQLIISISDEEHGQFEYVNNTGVAINNFTQEEINLSMVQFVHDGGEIPPAYKVSASDGDNVTQFASAEVTFIPVNDAPTALINNKLTIDEGSIVVLTTNNLWVNDIDTVDSSIRFQIINLQHGQFEFTTNSGVAVQNFTQQHVIDRQVAFRHDGSENAPGYNVLAGDGEYYLPVSAAVIDFVHVNDRPVLIKNLLTIDEGGSTILSSNNILATDADNSPDQLNILVTDVRHGQFEYITNLGTAVTTFTQEDITQGKVRFLHDGGEAPPAFNVKVRDMSNLVDGPYPASVTFIAVNDAPIVNKPVPNQEVDRGEPFEFSIDSDTFIDPDGDLLQLSATTDVGEQLPEWIQFDPAKKQFTGESPTMGTSRFSLFATDPSNAVARSNFNIETKDDDLNAVYMYVGIIGGIVAILSFFGIGALFTWLWNQGKCCFKKNVASYEFSGGISPFEGSGKDSDGENTELDVFKSGSEGKDEIAVEIPSQSTERESQYDTGESNIENYFFPEEEYTFRNEEVEEGTPTTPQTPLLRSK